jgi:hypothetical protein
MDMAANAKRKDPAAVALGRKGGVKGGLARAAKLTPEQRSESARKAVRARWMKAKTASGDMVPVGNRLRKEEMSDAVPVATSKKALHACLKRIKEAKNENDLRRLTEDLQRIVFHKQYRNA